ncbi:MAG: hypothetical protein EOO04_34095, partial [Chitinophagaceae bacterium]
MFQRSIKTRCESYRGGYTFKLQVAIGMNIDKKRWGEFRGSDIWLYTITSESMEISVTNYGCTVVSLRVRLADSKVANVNDRDGTIDEEKRAFKNILLGYPCFDELAADKYYMGCLVGRFAGRIGRAAFEIAGTRYNLPANDGLSGNHLHGGVEGFNKMIFDELSQDCGPTRASITFHGVSEDMDQGYPGKVEISFTMTLTNDNEITFAYLAKPDRPTHINLTHHLYYNLCDPQPGTFQNLFIDAGSVLQTGADYIPTGKIVPTPEYADFSQARKIPADINYNECYVLNSRSSTQVAATLSNISSGINMELSTSCP